MSEKNLRDHVSDYYRRRSLPDRKAQRLVGLARQTILVEELPICSSEKTWRPATWVRLAACVALLLVAMVLYLRQEEPAPGSALRQTVTARSNTVLADPAVVGLRTPNLVAVKIQANWCARTPNVAPVFADMTAKYGNQPILFVTLDITDDTGRQQARYMAANLGINSVYDDPFESGMIKLIDRQDGQVLAVLTGEEHRPELEVALAQALPPRP